jgi:hypothetical protein
MALSSIGNSQDACKSSAEFPRSLIKFCVQISLEFFITKIAPVSTTRAPKNLAYVNAFDLYLLLFVMYAMETNKNDTIYSISQSFVVVLERMRSTSIIGVLSDLKYVKALLTL